MTVVVRHDKRTGITPSAEGAAIDYNLIGIRDNKLLAATTTLLVLDVDTGVDG
jgi:hypothetical protein